MIKAALLLLCIAVAVHTTPVELTLRERQILLQADVDTKQAASPDYRLDGHVVPSHYEIWLRPYFTDEGDKAAFTFDGSVKITVRTAHSNQVNIVLHANRLTVANNWRVYDLLDPSIVIPHPDYEYDAVTHKLTLHLNRVLQPDRDYVIEMNYSGVMADDMAGFYRSYYKDNGVKKWLGSTQFQTTSARRAFPCFDEPKFKATFRIMIDRPANFQPSLSNTRIENSIALTSSLTRDTFKKTPKMSTYLIAFVVSDYRGRQTSNMVHGMHARSNAYEQTEYSLGIANNLVAKFDEFTGYPFLSVPELEKLDQVAVPDFSAGAMENWGLMTYRETSILYQPQHSTANNKHRIAAVISHEVAHQWFGDLVTCEWWDVTWLNEGFGRYFQYFGTRWVETEWELEKIYTVEQIQAAFQVDSLISTHAMTSEVNSPSQVSAIFDNISYNKGSAVLRMMEHMIGTDNFRLALQDYLRINAFSSTRPEHLWTAMQNRVTELQIARIMDPWTTQKGYPYITVHVTGTTVTITQKRFLVKDKDHTDTTSWPIPLTYATKESDFDNTLPQDIYYKENGAEHTITLTAAPERYLIMNIQQTGFYRVNYDVDNWMKIKDALNSENHGGIHELNRAQIVDDLFNFARAGIVDYGTALAILDYIKTERHYVPWLAFFNGLSYLTRRVAGNGDAELFTFHLMDLLEPVYQNIGFYPKDGDSQTQIYTRNNVLSWLCRYGHEDCLKNAREEFSKFVAAPETYSVNPDHRAVVYCEGLRAGNATDFNFLWNRYLTTNVGHEEITILNAMGCTKDPVLLKQLLTNLLTDAVRYQDKATVFSSALSSNPENVDVVFEFLTTNYDSWAANYGFNGMSAVASAFSSVTDRFTKPLQISLLLAFLFTDGTKLGDGPVSIITDAMDEARWQLQWADTHAPAIRQFLTDKKDNNSATSVAISLLCTLLSPFLLYLLY